MARVPEGSGRGPLETPEKEEDMHRGVWKGAKKNDDT